MSDKLSVNSEQVGEELSRRCWLISPFSRWECIDRRHGLQVFGDIGYTFQYPSVIKCYLNLPDAVTTEEHVQHSVLIAGT
jgi:hypothetical protein